MAKDAVETDTSLSAFRDFKPPFLGKFLFHFFPIRRSVVLSNMRIVFGNRLSGEELRNLAQRFYGHFALCLWENLFLGWLKDEEVRRKLQVINAHHVFEASAKGKGIIFMTGHFGNWELAAISSSLQFPDYRGRFHVIRRPLVNKFIERIAFGRFYRAGITVIPKKNSAHQVLEWLGRNDIVIFIMDQYAKPGRDGVEVEFFGRKTGTFKSLALVARTSGAVVIPMVSYRLSDGKHVMEFYDPLDWMEGHDSDEEILKNTRHYNQVLERMVLEHPDQWLWFHRRWKVKGGRRR